MLPNTYLIITKILAVPFSSPYARTFNVSLFYRPPSNTILPFLEELALFLPSISNNTILLGDFNIPTLPQVDHPFIDLPTNFNLIQHVPLRPFI